jgi:FKBP-type peptidyl-prolyl cis-trans isomerase
MQVLKNVSVFLAAAALLTACNSVDFKKTKAGVPYKLFSKGKGDSIRVGNVVKFEVVYKTKDTVMFDSYKQGTPQYIPLQAVPASFSYNDIGSNLSEIFLKAKKGDSIYITQSADSLLKDPQMTRAPFKKGDQVITTISIREVYKTNEEAQAAANKDRFANYGKMQAENLKRFKGDTSLQNQVGRDSKTIEEHLAKNNIQTSKTEWGIYVQVINPGQGPKPAPGQYVAVKYKGTTLQGQVFDSGVYPMQIGVGGSIPGFEMGVMELSKGGKANVYIPSTLAYGPRGSGPKIGPNENLIFELELLDISNTPIQPSAVDPLDTTRARQ